MIGIRVEESQYKAIRIHCVEQEMEMTEFFAEAFQKFVARRDEAAEEGREFIYRAPPKEARKVSTKGGDQKALAELRARAEKDNKQSSAAYYTATYEHLQDVQAGE
ncbi:MAG: hypothetical protein ABEN55_16205 [Bradymonadaceae bacterium]